MYTPQGVEQAMDGRGKICKVLSNSFGKEKLYIKTAWAHHLIKVQGICTLYFRAIYGKTPSHIIDLIHMAQTSRFLRANGKSPLHEPKYIPVTFGGRSFSSVAPGLWNNLPQHLRDCITEGAGLKLVSKHILPESLLLLVMLTVLYLTF